MYISKRGKSATNDVHFLLGPTYVRTPIVFEFSISEIHVSRDKIIDYTHGMKRRPKERKAGGCGGAAAPPIVKGKKEVGEEAPSNTCILSPALNSVLNADLCSDVTLLIDSPGDDVSGHADESAANCPGSIRAHRVVLSARSEYFRALFRSGMRDR